MYYFLGLLDIRYLLLFIILIYYITYIVYKDFVLLYINFLRTSISYISIVKGT